MTIKQISIQLENVPGALTRLLDILDKEDISTKAISAASTAESQHAASRRQRPRPGRHRPENL